MKQCNNDFYETNLSILPSSSFIRICFYLIVSFRKKGSKGFAPRGESWTIFILNTVVLLLIISTGGFTSTLFFLLYFLVFGIAFVFEPPTVFVFVVGAIIFFV